VDRVKRSLTRWTICQRKSCLQNRVCLKQASPGDCKELDSVVRDGPLDGFLEIDPSVRTVRIAFGHLFS
jgi:hypothetical protein